MIKKLFRALGDKLRDAQHKKAYDRGHRWVMDNIATHDLDALQGLVDGNALFSKTPTELAYDSGARAAVEKLRARRVAFARLSERIGGWPRMGSNPPPTYPRSPAPPAPPAAKQMVSTRREDYGQVVHLATSARPVTDAEARVSNLARDWGEINRHDMAFWPTQQMMRVAEPVADAPAVRSGGGGDFAGAGGGGSWGDSPSGDSGSYGGTSD